MKALCSFPKNERVFLTKEEREILLRTTKKAGNTKGGEMRYTDTYSPYRNYQPPRYGSVRRRQAPFDWRLNFRIYQDSNWV